MGDTHVYFYVDEKNMQQMSIKFIYWINKHNISIWWEHVAYMKYWMLIRMMTDILLFNMIYPLFSMYSLLPGDIV